MPISISDSIFKLPEPEQEKVEYKLQTVAPQVCKEENICKVGEAYHMEYAAKQAQLQQIKQGQKK